MRWASDPQIDGLNLILDPAETSSSWLSLMTELRKRLHDAGKELIVTTVTPAKDRDDAAEPEDATFHLPAREPEALQVAESALTLLDSPR